jgi:hypothetical protein
MAGGNVSNISNAKSRITYAVVGLILILGSNLVLSSINPNLTIFKPLVLGKIERIELNGELSDNGVADLVSSGIYFKQCDEKWGNMAYTEGGSGCNLCSSGCGPTAMAIVLSSKGINVTPADIGQWAIEVGARKDCSGGTNLSLLTQKIGEKWSGVKGEIITNFDKAMDYLNNGSWLIVSIRKVPVPGHCLNSKCGKEICFCGGHFVVAAGKTGDTIHIIDPSRVGINSLTVSQLKNYLSTGNFYHIWK